jgi:excinuclease ABC subunit C
MQKFIFIQKEKRNKLPKTSGVYAFKDKGAILYIGKATNLRERIKNHFSQPTYKDSYLTKQTGKIGFIKTGSEIEALILEANLIKIYKPKYNVVWKDDKNYFFIAITKEAFPKIFITHQKDNSKIDYIGPFVDGNALKQVLKILRKVFPYRTCNPPSGGLPKKPCLWYQLNRCPAP